MPKLLAVGPLLLASAASYVPVAGSLAMIGSKYTGPASSESKPSCSGSSPTTPIVSRWADDKGREEWYAAGKDYWERAAAEQKSMLGMLGEHKSVNAADLLDSVKFIQPLWPLPSKPRDTRALDVGAGIGRVTGGLLLELCDTVDLMDGCANFVEQARENLGWASPRVERFIVADMQAFEPEAGRYHLVWLQWCLMNLTDADVCSLLRRCKASLVPGGLIVVKDNVMFKREAREEARVLDSGLFVVDEEDKSVTRTREHLLWLLGGCGLEVVAEAKADLRRPDLHEVINLALS